MNISYVEIGEKTDISVDLPANCAGEQFIPLRLSKSSSLQWKKKFWFWVLFFLCEWHHK